MPWGSDFHYKVADVDGNTVAAGVSSNTTWAKQDAGGNHTKKKFDELYGEDNWEVNFDWEE